MLQHCLWDVELASELRAWEGEGDADKQAEIESRGREIASQLIKKYKQLPREKRPACWFTYHVYHKAPDWIGPAVSAALKIPYVIAEASVARKQQDGKWQAGYAASLKAVRQAALIFNLNSNDLPGLEAVIPPSTKVIQLKPFTDVHTDTYFPVEAAHISEEMKSSMRSEFAQAHSLDEKKHWLLCVAMMRPGDKLESYLMLAETMKNLQRTDWQLLLVGDGSAAQQVADLFNAFPNGQIHFLGSRPTKFVHRLMRASDLFVWPAKNEAFGMAVLEALGCGLPVVAGVSQSSGIGDIVYSGVSGILVKQPTGSSIAAEVENLLASPATLQKMSAASVTTFNQYHQFDKAAIAIDGALQDVTGIRALKCFL